MYLLYIVKTILLNKPFLNYNSFYLKKRVYKTFNNNIKAQFVICLPSNSLFSFENLKLSLKHCEHAIVCELMV